MENRSKNVFNLRPIISEAKVTSLTTDEESFQNITLRPIAKLQNDLLLEIFKNYIVKRKNVYHTLSIQKQAEYIEHAVKNDTKLRNIIKGVFIGLFTYDEYLKYTQNNRGLNKRITNLTIERLKNNMQYFENMLAS